MTKRRGLILGVIVVLLATASALYLSVGRQVPQRPVARTRPTAPAVGGASVTPTTAPSASPSPTAVADSAYLAVLPQRPASFAASFAGSQLDSSIWGTCYPQADPSVGCTNFGNPDEFEWYLPSQDQVSGGVLRLIAQQEQTAGLAQDGSPQTYGCRSGLVTTYPGFHFQYGFLQVVAKIPHAAGLWSALWLAAADQQWPPEVDMIENWGVDQESAAFLHPYPTSLGYDKGFIPVSLTSDWQTFSLYWTSSELEFFVGSTLIMNVTSNVPQQEMYFVANVAEYEPAAPGNCSGELDIQSLKYWPLS
ncbi:MAG: family 16 glycosylhydrolase [Streptosporangiaceae bacterium]